MPFGFAPGYIKAKGIELNGGSARPPEQVLIEEASLLTILSHTKKSQKDPTFLGQQIAELKRRGVKYEYYPE